MVTQADVKVAVATLIEAPIRSWKVIDDEDVERIAAAATRVLTARAALRPQPTPTGTTKRRWQTCPACGSNMHSAGRGRLACKCGKMVNL